jgi:hypothetical protein
MDVSSVSRRQFLVAGSALALAAPLLLKGDLASRGPNALERMAARPGLRLPLRYVEADPAQPLAAAAGAPLVAAAAITSGDRSLEGRALSLRVAGLTEGAGEVVSNAMLDALIVPSASAVEPAPFYAFTHRAGATSTPVTLAAIGDRRPSVGLALTHDGMASSTVFTTRSADGLARLREGWYLVDLGQIGAPVAGRVPAAGDPVWRSMPSLALAVAAA